MVKLNLSFPLFFFVLLFTGATSAELTAENVRAMQKSVDSDKDGISNWSDNCPGVANPDQKDQNKNGIGDLCEPKSEKPKTKARAE